MRINKKPFNPSQKSPGFSPRGSTSRSSFYYERKLKTQGHGLVIGVDEAGRGPLAGPVVAAAVILKARRFVNRIEDSKQLNSAERQKAFLEIAGKSIFALGVVNHRWIDRENILRASLLAMRKAIARLGQDLSLSERKQVFVIVDGKQVPETEFSCRSIIRGDAKSKSIAAASILAKVTRDRIMEKFDRIYPGYGFGQHKGYPTSRHRAIIRQRGPSPIHRRSFLRCVGIT